MEMVESPGFTERVRIDESVPESVVESTRQYVIRGTRFDDEFDLGVSLPEDSLGEYDLPSEELYSVLYTKCHEMVDIDLIDHETTETVWPVVGECVLERNPERAVELAVTVSADWQ